MSILDGFVNESGETPFVRLGTYRGLQWPRSSKILMYCGDTELAVSQVKTFIIIK